MANKTITDSDAPVDIRSADRQTEDLRRVVENLQSTPEKAHTSPIRGVRKIPHHRQSEGGLIPGSRVGQGRYRLLASYGGHRCLQFWHGFDNLLGRPVALTVVDTQGVLPVEDVQEIMWRTVRLARMGIPGVAPLLDAQDAAGIQAGALLVAEWIRGGSLREVATKPSPIGVAGAMQSLAAAADTADRAGFALSIDHPNRLRVSTEGEVALAFPGVMPDATAQDDVHGIGGATYALLVNRWPTPDTTTPPDTASSWAPIERDSQGQPKEPAAIDPEIPFLVSAAAAGAVREPGGINTAATVLSLLQQATTEAAQAASDQQVPEPPQLPPPGRYAHFRDAYPTLPPDTRRRLLIGLGIAAAIIMVVVLASMTSALSRVMGNDNGGVVLAPDRLGLHAPSSAAAPPSGAAVASGVVKPIQATVFSPGGAPDNPQSAQLAIDGNPATAWSTDSYFDAQPFPKFKDGVGLLLQLPQSTVLRAVTVDLDSTGTVMQIRSAPTAIPAKLADTTALTPPTPMQPGHNTIPVNNPTATSNVLVWISTLGSTGGESRSDISEITLHGASQQP
jgi:putative peptidoglycan lipid II flippase